MKYQNKLILFHIILSNFTSDPRKGEELVGEKYFNQMGYKTAISPHKWEGEADLKYLYGNKYIGGYGIRSDIKAYEWMEEQYGMDILKLEMVDEYLYHLDCSIFALNNKIEKIVKMPCLIFLSGKEQLWSESIKFFAGIFKRLKSILANIL